MTADPILIVDDDDNLRTVMAEALEVLPVEITQAASGLLDPIGFKQA